MIYRGVTWLDKVQNRWAPIRFALYPDAQRAVFCSIETALAKTVSRILRNIVLTNGPRVLIVGNRYKDAVL
jgi:hypothetical protein